MYECMSGERGILIPAYVDASGRDSFGRGLDAGSIAAAVASDRATQREREALWNYLCAPIAIPTRRKRNSMRQ
jgi:hypothetical protein